jgi:sugar O-acyltransferase (sialic acid O-acetyltransferase NeuD family)
MLIIGAKGFAKEVLEVLHQQNQLENVCFYDDINEDIPNRLYNKYLVLRSTQEATIYFKEVSNKFTIGIGNPILRKKLYDKFTSLGGEFTSTISPMAIISSFDVNIGIGSNVLSGSVFSNGCEVGMGCIVYYNSIITHDCKVGDFVEISPSVTLLGRSKVGSYSRIGSNATILPDIEIGKNVTIGAGSVVTKDLPDNCVAVGIPAKIIKELSPLEF